VPKKCVGVELVAIFNPGVTPSVLSPRRPASSNYGGHVRRQLIRGGVGRLGDLGGAIGSIHTEAIMIMFARNSGERGV